ncbi:MAG: hypothetical protein ABIF87_07115 [Pseudomonadota bacterium]
MAQSPDEKTYVEVPFIEQLKGMGWDHIEGDIDVPYLRQDGGHPFFTQQQKHLGNMGQNLFQRGIAHRTIS